MVDGRIRVRIALPREGPMAAAAATTTTAAEEEEELAAFSSTGVYRIRRAPAFFMDPVRVLNRTYSRFQLSPSSYYCRFFAAGPGSSGEPQMARKKRRRRRSPLELNEREAAAERRHQVSLFIGWERVLLTNGVVIGVDCGVRVEKMRSFDLS